jgi:hypothetical protein
MPERKLQRRPILDPVVADLINDMEQKQADSMLPRREREKKTRERAKIQARRDQRATYDLPPAVRARIMELSEELRLPASQLVTLALARFLKEYEAGKIDLAPYKQSSASPRYDWNLVLPEDLLPAAAPKKKPKKATRTGTEQEK